MIAASIAPTPRPYFLRFPVILFASKHSSRSWKEHERSKSARLLLAAAKTVAGGAHEPERQVQQQAGARQTGEGYPMSAYTHLVVDSAPALNATLYDKLTFNFIRDIAPVASIARQPGVMVINPSLSAKTVPELVAYAKANPGKLNMASGGTGNISHVEGELFKMMTGVSMVHVP
jgi:hypothetical protein